MTREIYFFLMALIMTLVPLLVVRVIKKQPHIDSNIIYLIFASCFTAIWIFLPREISTIREINFLQHMIGGGVAVSLVSIYFFKSLQNEYPLLKNFIVQIIIVYALVSMLGIANELMEFLLDTLKIGVFSTDRYDTWFDLLANTSGAVLAYVIYFPFRIKN